MRGSEWARLVEENTADDRGADLAEQVLEHLGSQALMLYRRITRGVGFQPDGNAQRLDPRQVINP